MLNNKCGTGYQVYNIITTRNRICFISVLPHHEYCTRRYIGKIVALRLAAQRCARQAVCNMQIASLHCQRIIKAYFNF